MSAKSLATAERFTLVWLIDLFKFIIKNLNNKSVLINQKSALAERYNIDFDKTKVLVKDPAPWYVPYLEGIEIYKFYYNLNRDLRNTSQLLLSPPSLILKINKKKQW